MKRVSKWRERIPGLHRHWILPAIALLALTATLALWHVFSEFQLRREQAQSRVQSVAALRVAQVETWVQRQMRLADFLVDSSFLGDLYLRWREQGDSAAGEHMLQRIVKFRHSNDADAALVVDADGNVLASEHPAAESPSPDMVRAVQRAIATRSPAHTTIYRQDGSAMPLRMDVVIPLLATGTPPRGAIVVRIDPQRSLYPLLGEWPVPTTTGESILWQEADGQLTALSDARWHRGSATRLVRPLPSTGPLADPAHRSAPSPSLIVTGKDYRGATVLASVLPVPGTDWWLAAKIDLDEVDQPTWAAAGWMLAAVLLALVGIAFGGRLWMQRMEFDNGRRERDAHRERLKTLSLLEAIASSTSELIFAKDLEGRFIFYNRASAEMFGKSSTEMLGRTIADLFGEELAARLAPNDRAVLESLRQTAFEEVLPTPRGVVALEYTKAPLYDGEGRLIGLINVARDVTGMRQAERALRDSDAHYRSVVSVLAEGIVVCDTEGKVISCNPAAETILGVQQAHWRGAPIVPPGWVPLYADGTPMPVEATPPARALAGAGAQRDVVMALRSPSGAQAFYSVSSTPVLASDSGALLAVATSFVDVTHKRRMEADLERHRDALEELVAERTSALQSAYAALEDAAGFNRTISDSIPGMVAYWDTGRRCRYANRAYAQWFGAIPEKLLGIHVEDLFGEATYAHIRPRMEAALTGAPQVFERENRRADGEVAVLQVHMVPEKDSAGRTKGVLVMAFDITALKRSEQALQSSNHQLELSRDKAEAANRAKSAFLANMSHEIRTPMNAVIGMAHLLSRDAMSPTQRDRLGKIDAAAQHLLRIIDDILDLSKIEAGKLHLEDSVFSLHGVLRSTVEMLHTGAKRKGLDLEVDIAPLPDQVRGDSTRLSQMLINLLSNAIKFTDTGWVRLRVQPVQEDGARLQLRVEVQDTGIGIPTERQAQLFHSFEQADSSTTRRFGGTGLGLALTRQFAEAMGGQTGVISLPGSGSTFWVTAWIAHADPAHKVFLPVQAQPATAAPRRAPEGRSALQTHLERLRRRHAGKRILLAEDNLVNQEVASELLRMAGLDVDTAETGEEAIAMVRSHHYDLVLMDMQMPETDGLQATRALRAAGHAMPIIAMTANAFVEDRAACLEAGMDDHLAKPVNPASLYGSLLGWMSKDASGEARAWSASELEAESVY